MSIRWRILGAFVFIIIFTILLSTGFDYWEKRSELGDFSTKVRTFDLAKILSEAYTDAQGWDSLNGTLIRQGFMIDPDKKSDDWKRTSFYVVVQRVEGDVLVDTFAILDADEQQKQIVGKPEEIYNFDTRQVVGTVTIYVSRDLVEKVSLDYLLKTFTAKLTQGLIIAVISIVLALIFSRQITNPVIALTRATQAVAEGAEAILLPVTSSDELGQMSTSFNQMIGALQTQRDLRKRLVDDVSHELNTPLSVIRLEAKGLLDGLKPADEVADQIINEVDTLANLVTDLNLLAETDSGSLELNFEFHSIAQLLKTEVERWQLQAQAANLELELLLIPEDLTFIKMDAVRISQALGNLINNSLQFTSEGKVTVMCVKGINGVEISVCDSGSGISADDLPFVFERFYRADLSRQKTTGGRGLGLSIAKQIVEEHQGHIWVKSEAGKGSCFYFNLPG